MDLQTHNPDSITRPASRYAQGVSADGASCWLHISGQVGVGPDGTLAADARGQTQRCFDNILAVLEDADMNVGNLVKITGFITDTRHLQVFRDVRDEVLDGHLCASTLLVVSALANPDWVVEIEAVAAA